MVQYIQKSENYFQKIYSNGKKVRVSKSEFLKNEMKGGKPKKKESEKIKIPTHKPRNVLKEKNKKKKKKLKELYVNVSNNDIMEKFSNIDVNKITNLQKKIRESKSKIVESLFTNIDFSDFYDKYYQVIIDLEYNLENELLNSRSINRNNRKQIFNKFIYGDKEEDNDNLQKFFLSYLRHLCFKRLPSMKNISQNYSKNDLNEIFNNIDVFINELIKNRGNILDCYDKNGPVKNTSRLYLTTTFTKTKREREKRKYKNNKRQRKEDNFISQEIKKRENDFSEKIRKKIKKLFEDKIIKHYNYNEYQKFLEKVRKIIIDIENKDYIKVFKSYKLATEEQIKAKLDEYPHIPNYFSFIKENYKSFFKQQFEKLQNIIDKISNSLRNQNKNTTKRLHELKSETEEQIKAKLDEFSNLGGIL